MLNVQRQRYSTTKEDTFVLRGLLIAHFIIGILAVMFLLMHELLPYSVGVLLWYLTTLGAVFGMMNGYSWCRPGLASLFLLIAIGGAVFVNQVFPSLNPDRQPVLSHKLLPLWMVGMALLYAAGALTLMMSARIKKSALKGFSFW
jgi:hypothetical protein